jgi:hypothetical protein
LRTGDPGGAKVVRSTLLCEPGQEDTAGFMAQNEVGGVS